MKSWFSTTLRVRPFQVLLLIALLWVLDMRRIPGDVSSISFLLAFAMLTPHLFDVGPTFMALFAYIAIAVISAAVGHPIAFAAPLPELASDYSALLLATLASAASVGRRPRRRTKAIFGIYYLATLYMGIRYAYAARFAASYLLIWPALLFLLPVLTFWRLRAFVPRLWQTAAPVVVYIPVRFIVFCLVSPAAHGQVSWNLTEGVEQVFQPTALFGGIVLPLGPYFLMAVIAAAILEHLNGWTLRTVRSVKSEGRMRVSELDEQDLPGRAS
ncbi:MAG: hypothetical protein DRH70_02680 [Candidatus Coatesbacteria bacterium]|nr:MAG: hypothetical protein DRH70_02680 [Candidatus Coatesbacteria bacterium]